MGSPAHHPPLETTGGSSVPGDVKQQTTQAPGVHGVHLPLWQLGLLRQLAVQSPLPKAAFFTVCILPVCTGLHDGGYRSAVAGECPARCARPLPLPLIGVAPLELGGCMVETVVALNCRAHK
eukprot:6528167-Lingulodinium_polyedra.AAC.1